MAATVPPGVAAGHPATAAAGWEMLADGGTAADAGVAAVLASCVAETVMTGLTGGGHAVYWDAAAGRAWLIDCFVAVPGLGDDGPRRGAWGPRRGAWHEVGVAFGSQVVDYAIGAGTCAVPGVPAGCDLLWRRWGRLPWRRVVEPALQLARGGVPMPPTHAACLEMLAPVMTLAEGDDIYRPGGRLLGAGERLHQPGLVAALEALDAEGAATFYRGTLAEALLATLRERGGVVTRRDLEAYEARCDPARASVGFAGHRAVARRDLSDLLGSLARLDRLSGSGPAERALGLVEVLTGARGAGHTTSAAVVDAEGNACAVATSLGLGAGEWLAGFDLHLNSMLGEIDLLRDGVGPGERLDSNMAPTLLFGGDGLAAAVGAAGGTRIRSATAQVLFGLLVDGLAPVAAVAAPRLHPLGRVVHAEEGVAQPALAALERAGHDVRRWSGRHHYFGGVSVAARGGAAGDPRRDGAARPHGPAG